MTWYLLIIVTFKSLRSIDSHGQKSRTDWLSELEQNIFKWPLEKVRSSTTNWLIFQWKNIRGLDTHSWSYTQIGRSIPRGKKQRERERPRKIALGWITFSLSGYVHTWKKRLWCWMLGSVGLNLRTTEYPVFQLKQMSFLIKPDRG